MDWTAIGGVVALIGMLVTLGTITAKISTSFGKFDAAVKRQEEFIKNSQQTHRDLYHAIENDEKEIAKHEVRIHNLEEWKKDHQKQSNHREGLKNEN